MTQFEHGAVVKLSWIFLISIGSVASGQEVDFRPFYSKDTRLFLLGSSRATHFSEPSTIHGFRGQHLSNTLPRANKVWAIQDADVRKDITICASRWEFISKALEQLSEAYKSKYRENAKFDLAERNERNKLLHTESMKQRTDVVKGKLSPSQWAR